MEWPLRWPDLTPIYLFLWGFEKDSVCIPPPGQHYTKSIHASESPVQKLITEYSVACGNWLNIGLVLLEPLMALTINFING
jgi:hypothetical protein